MILFLVFLFHRYILSQSHDIPYPSSQVYNLTFINYPSRGGGYKELYTPLETGSE